MERDVMKDAFREFDKFMAALDFSMAEDNARACSLAWAQLKVAIVQGLETKPEPVMAWPAAGRRG
jgi:hypothetical protein